MLITSLVPTKEIHNVWTEAAPILDKSILQRDLYDISSLFELVLQNNHQLWVIFDDADNMVVAAATTQVVAYPLRKHLAIPFIGGTRMKEWLGDFLDLMSKYAKDLGCEGLEGYGRKGWGRELPKYGFKTVGHIFMKLNLEDTQ